MSESLFACRDCGVILTRENTGGYRQDRPDVCKACERAYDQFVYEQFVAHEHYDDFVRAVMGGSMWSRHER